MSVDAPVKFYVVRKDGAYFRHYWEWTDITRAHVYTTPGPAKAIAKQHGGKVVVFNASEAND